jgi:hypothetical protein
MNARWFFLTKWYFKRVLVLVLVLVLVCSHAIRRAWTRYKEGSRLLCPLGGCILERKSSSDALIAPEHLSVIPSLSSPLQLCTKIIPAQSALAYLCGTPYSTRIRPFAPVPLTTALGLRLRAHCVSPQRQGWWPFLWRLGSCAGSSHCSHSSS